MYMYMYVHLPFTCMYRSGVCVYSMGESSGGGGERGREEGEGERDAREIEERVKYRVLLIG